MKIKSLKVGNIFSFGNEQELNDFSDYNLLIGKNGSGKTSTLKILKGLDVEYTILNNASNEIDTTYKMPVRYFSGPVSEERNVNLFIPNISTDYINQGSIPSSGFPFKVEIIYEQEIDGEIKEDTILFEDVAGSLRYVQGNIIWQHRCVIMIELSENEFEFYKDLSSFLGSKAKSKLPFLNLGLFYIFGLHYHFRQDGTFLQFKSKNLSGIVEEDTSHLPSGVLYCAKLLTRYLMSDCTVILIDEPELHLEPRCCRRLFEYLIWMNTKDDTINNKELKGIFNKVCKVIGSAAAYKKGQDATFWSIAEGNAIYDITDNFKPTKKQIFIASHSSYLINSFLKLKELTSIYEFDLITKSFVYENKSGQKGEKLVTSVRKIDSDATLILDNLGCKGSDLLQANGIIWVEGPSDVVYINKWLEMYAAEMKLEEFRQGIEYEFQMYGGTLLDSICLDWENRNNDEKNKLVAMFSFSRNNYVVIDSDAKTEYGEVTDISNFKDAKHYIRGKIMEKIDQANQNKSLIPQIGLWYKEGDVDIRTIESYLDDDSLKIKGETKKVRALKIVEYWNENNKNFSDFKPGLKKEIEILYNMIVSWNHDGIL
jgi:hypothetical protein